MKVMVVGAGKLGYSLARSMIQGRIDVTLVDSDERVIERISDHLDVLTVNANGIEVSVLRELDIQSYDLLIACTGSDETNAIICTMAKKLGCRRAIARIGNPEYTKQLDFVKSELGIDHIVNPDLATANEIMRYLLRSYNFHMGDFAKGKVSMAEFSADHMEEFIGKRLFELPDLGDLLVAAISRNGEMIIPHGSTELCKDDILHMIGTSESIKELANRFQLSLNGHRVRRVMILGGGKLSFYLAEQLASAGIAVTIVEENAARCQYLAERLDKVLIIQGDGTDISLLEEEQLSEMDAFIGATGYDEQNLLMCLLAKQAGVSKTIAKISRQSYVNLIDKLDLDVALNPTSITSSDILKFIRGGRVVSVSLLLDGKAEVTELIVSPNVPVVGKPLAEWGLPKGIIIGAIVHNGQVIIPNGQSVVHPNDRLIIFCLADDVPALDIFLRPAPSRGGVLGEFWRRQKSSGRAVSS
jgi:trk system potassium uptake protein TrkA